MKKIYVLLFCVLIGHKGWSKAIVDADLNALVTHYQSTQFTPSRMILIFLKDGFSSRQIAQDIHDKTSIQVQAYDALPVILASLPFNPFTLNYLSNYPGIAQISLIQGGQEELDVSEQSILLKPSVVYPKVNNWWAHGYTGINGVLGLIDSGIAVEHPSLQGKQIHVRQETGSGYEQFKNGVRSAHGTGVACIYSGQGSYIFPGDMGIAHGNYKIITGLAGEGIGNIEDVGRTLSTLDWMLTRAPERPNVINYSYGNGLNSCEECPSWSSLAKVMDYVINKYHILWVKSAGNKGYVNPATPSSMTVPADNYNGLTVANMNTTVLYENKFIPYPDRSMHAIKYTSSRGPTLDGRKKPDITAPGNNTWTCAPDPEIYPFNYLKDMNYHDGYRFMGGTSSATPHVGAAILLLNQAGITNPMAQKALLINSADAWVDNNQAGPDDPNFSNSMAHREVMGSEWNRTYGWGYLNLQQAFEQRNNVVTDFLNLKNPIKMYRVHLPVGAKVTLVHERRVGFSDNYRTWQLSHLSLQLIDEHTNKILYSDNSAIDTVHQVANCIRPESASECSNDQPIDAIIKVSLLSNEIDGSLIEPFALCISEPIVE